MDASQIKKLYVKKLRSEVSGGSDIFFAVYARTENQGDVELIGNVLKEEAKFIEREMEGYLGIVNEPVKGEYEGSAP